MENFRESASRKKIFDVLALRQQYRVCESFRQGSLRECTWVHVVINQRQHTTTKKKENKYLCSSASLGALGEAFSDELGAQHGSVRRSKLCFSDNRGFASGAAF